VCRATTQVVDLKQFKKGWEREQRELDGGSLVAGIQIGESIRLKDSRPALQEPSDVTRVTALRPKPAQNLRPEYK
jgi:hypothetical protein